MEAALCGGVSANAVSVWWVAGVSAGATARSRSAVSRACMAGGSGWTSNACSRAQGLIAKDSGGGAQAGRRAATWLHDALPRGSRHYAAGHVRPAVPAGLRTCGRGSRRSAYLSSLPSHGGPVHVKTFVSALPLRGSSVVTPDSLLSQTDATSVWHRRTQHIGWLGKG